MKILYLVFNRVGRGTYWRALGFARELAVRGHHVSLLASSNSASSDASQRNIGGVTVIQTPDRLRGSGYDLWQAAERLKWVHGREFDLIHAFETRPTNIVPGLYLQRRQGIPLLSDWCDWFGRGGSVEERASFWMRAGLRPVETFFEERCRSRAEGISVINSVLRERAARLGFSSERTLLLPNGANVNEIYPQEREQVRARLGLRPDEIYLAYTGSIFQRDAQLMAQSFNIIRAAQPAARLLLIGYCNVPVETLVQTPEAVIRTGQVSFEQLADYVAAADIGWLPLTDRGANRGRFPMKAHDFMAAGRPLVVTDVGDLGHLVSSRKIGGVARADNPIVLAETTLALLKDREILEKMGQRARHVAETEFAWPIVTDRLEAWYREWKR